MKKLSVVAVAVCLFVGSSFAEWGKFGVIEDGSAEAKFGIYGGDAMALYIHYGLLENLELFSTAGTVSSNYTLGAKYMIIPLLGGFLDLDLPTMKDEGSYNFGLTPGINVTTSFSDKLSFGSTLKLGVELDGGVNKDGDKAARLDLTVGVEFDYMFSDNIGAWLGVDFVYDRLTTRAEGEEFDAASAITPGIGFFFTKDNLTVGTMLNAINFKHPNPSADDPEKTSIGISGGVEVCVKF
ncbi:hypothetical protein R80B4_02744 [Fibrobacteres bacterium R8-0-B4]